MTPKQIDRAAGKIFRATVPNNYAYRSQEDQEDYGVDAELELTDENDRATGFIFKVQQKGAENATLIDGGTVVSFGELPVAKMRYYLKQMHLPLVFVVVDLKAGFAYWTTLQGRPEVHAAYEAAVATSQGKMTVHLPTANILPATFDRMIEAVHAAQEWITLEHVRNAPSPERLASAVLEADFEATFTAFNLQANIFRCEQIERWLKANDEDRAFATAETIFASPAETIAMRFAAALYLIRIETVRTLHRRTPDRDARIIKLRLRTTEELFKLTQTKGAEQRRLRLFALFLLRSARLHSLVQKHQGLSLSIQTQQFTGDTRTRALTAHLRTPVAASIIHEIRHLEFHLLWFLRRQQFHFFVPAWAGLVRDLLPFIGTVREQGETALADSLAGWLETTGTIGIEISRGLKHWGDVSGCALQTISLAPDHKDEPAITKRFEAVRAIIETIPDPEARAKGLANHSQLQKSIGNPTRNLDDLLDGYRKMAEAHGVNLADENNPLSQAINIGLKDFNPERALKTCIHLYVKPHTPGFFAQKIGLTTAGFKTLKCAKFGYECSAFSLDDVFADFNRDNCSKCTEGEPHPPDWHWSFEWQAEQDKLHGASVSEPGFAG